MVRVSTLNWYFQRDDLLVEWLEDGMLLCDRMIAAMRAETGIETGEASVCAGYETGDPQHGYAGQTLPLGDMISATCWVEWRLDTGPEWRR